jgi:hypothetical protein
MEVTIRDAYILSDRQMAIATRDFFRTMTQFIPHSDTVNRNAGATEAKSAVSDVR